MANRHDDDEIYTGWATPLGRTPYHPLTDSRTPVSLTEIHGATRPVWPVPEPDPVRTASPRRRVPVQGQPGVDVYLPWQVGLVAAVMLVTGVVLGVSIVQLGGMIR